MDIQEGTKVRFTRTYERLEGRIIVGTFKSLVWTDVDGPETGPDVIYGFKAKIEYKGAYWIIPLKDIVEPVIN